MELTPEVICLIKGLVFGIYIILSIWGCASCWREGIFDYVDDGCDEAMAGAIETLKKKEKCK